jgi:hypothetical protein
MREQREPRAIIEAAEQAAAAGNYASAEELLREAALLQEADLGPLDPDLANTLNNLGVVCEITDKPIDAERCFRRAVTIATTVLEPDHPFVATSRKNLLDFCEARGREEAVKPEAEATSSEDPPRESRLLVEPQDLQPLVRWRFFRAFALHALSAGAGITLVMFLTTGSPWPRSNERAQSSAIVVDAPREIPVPPPAPLPVEPIPVPKETMKTAPSMPARPTPSIPARLIVVKAQLCAELYKWQCDPADRPVPPGPLFFYTQVTSTTATTVQHRWYRDNRLHQSIKFHVQASPSVGYRTYSSNTMNNQSAGSWRVELTTEDGVLLHEERFSVR